MSALAALLAFAMATPIPPFPFETDRVLDIERLRAVRCNKNPSDTSDFADVLVVGGGVGGCAAALAIAAGGHTVILVEPTRAVGGQLTSQLVPVPDENSHIEKEPGPSSRTWRRLRETVRERCARIPNIKPQHAANVGQCWVSRISALPEIWEDSLAEMFQPHRQSGRIKAVFTRHQIRSVGLYSGNGDLNWADIVDLDTGTVRRVAAKFAIDATEDGSLMALAGTPTRIGQEAASEFNEPHAPTDAHPEWVQSFTYGFLMRWTVDGQPRSIVAPPGEYEEFRSLGEYTLDYVYRGQTPEPFSVPYKVLRGIEGDYGGKTRRYLPFWSYRRLHAASSMIGGTSPVDDIALVNWRGNDFHGESWIGKPLDEQVRILRRGRDFARGFAHWLQTSAPRDDDDGHGWPEMQLDRSSRLVDEDGLAIHPYVRESRRLVSRRTLTENDLLPGQAQLPWGTEFGDAVGCGLYAIDIHPSANEPPLLQPALPFHLPLGAFLPVAGPRNLVPGAKNFGATRLALAAARMHPTEWLAGEIAGNLVAFTLDSGLRDVAEVDRDEASRGAFQNRLSTRGITLRWRDILGPG